MTRPDLIPRTHQRFPASAVQRAKQKRLTLGASTLLLPQEAGGDHLALIEYQYIPGIKIIDHIGKHPMLDLPFPVDYHKPAMVSLLRRGLGNQLLWKLVIITFRFISIHYHYSNRLS